ncbi:lipid-A-disaccharide synthase [Cyanobium sp. HWJ4-Hawea]|uniref:lipid-A-disaccharide synthase n=1 Tax=unclassified Cyanobium TaxID=2627006 RepID=UPI0020CD315D|nr:MULTISPECIES: lipid-A-disaccharide synthase [unclassified Cyanobium]MCP9775806.1 lipid-A-disaccharide synthase [Cyanobium sp. WAJ14-Wanaka]MCP9808383.1 lipid-A-disaccharide synthase [Cyanobium sp. HWJ4-Hawea]
MAEDGPRILLVAGEASGDLHGGAMLRELRRLLPGVQVVGVGGDNLRAQGMETLADVSTLSAAGLVEIAASIPRHYRVMEMLKQQMDQHRPKAVVLVDYPGFNMFVAKEAKKRGIPVFFYIAPQVWAWGKGRAKTMAQLIDRLAVIFPFEEEIFNRYGRAVASYVGHPLMDSLKTSRSPGETRQLHGFDLQQPLLVLMPGSRRSEVHLLLPAMLGAAQQLKADGWQVALLKAPTISESFLKRSHGKGPFPVPVVEGDAYNLLAAADAGVIASGTATLEAALLGCPHVILYRFSLITYLLGKLFIRHRTMGLPNVILGRPFFPELLQRRVTPANIVRAVAQMAANRQACGQAVDQLRSAMGQPGASDRAAHELAKLIK